MRPGVIASLRDLVPLRPLTCGEHLRIAELQASRFLKLVGVNEAPVPERAISELPRVHVEHMSPFPVSGATHWSSGQWLVALNGAEPRVRQRFSLAHELKHSSTTASPDSSSTRSLPRTGRCLSSKSATTSPAAC
jgi:hypothetical protein